MYYIDLEKMCEDFINGKVEIEDILNKSKLDYFRIVKSIKKYCINNGILIDDNLLYRLEISIRKMYNLLLSGMSYVKIVKQYGCSGCTVKNKLVKYEDERNKYLEMLLYDFNQIIDGILSKEPTYFYGDGQKERHADGYSFVKNNKNT